MGKSRNPRQFTKKETIERLQEVKSYLGNKDRLSFCLSGICVPSGYKPEEDESYYAAPQLENSSFKWLADNTRSFIGHDWRNDPRFLSGSASKFVDYSFKDGAVIGQCVVVVFYSYKDGGTTKVSSLWLGTWHHAPIVAWANSFEIKVNFLPKYIDLIH